MNEAIYAPPSANLEVAEPRDDAMFYVVSKRKLAVLFIATLGLYMFYWFYKNWSLFKEARPYAAQGEGDIWPVARAIFALFFIHSLFRLVKGSAPEDSPVKQWHSGADATILVLLLIVSSGLDRAAGKSIGSPVTDWLSIAILAPLLLYFCKAQAMINLSCGDAQGARNDEFTGANIAWIVVGTVAWILAIIGTLLPE